MNVLTKYSKTSGFIIGLALSIGVAYAANNYNILDTPTGGGTGVSSFNSRAGTVVPAANDYTFAQLANKPTTATGYGLVLVSGDIPNNAANTSGTAALATALVTNPTDCSSNQYAIAIDASGNLTCTQVANTQITGLGTASTAATGTAGGTLCFLNTACNFSNTVIFSVNGAAGASGAPVSVVGSLLTGSSGTNNVPQIWVQPFGTTNVTTWATLGTFLGINAASGFTGNFLDFHINGGSTVFKVSSSGTLSIGSTAFSSSGVNHNNGSAITGVGDGTTTGAVTIGNGSSDTIIAAHIASSGTAPTVSGTGCAGSGTLTDTRGAITSTAATSCTVTFATTYTTAPICIPVSSSTTIPTSVSSVSATAVTFGMAALTGTIYYVCLK